MVKFGGTVPLVFFIVALLIISIFCFRFLFLADKFVKERGLGDDAGALARIIGIFQLPYIIYGLLMIFIFDNGFVGANIYFVLLAMTFAGVFIVHFCRMFYIFQESMEMIMEGCSQSLRLL